MLLLEDIKTMIESTVEEGKEIQKRMESDLNNKKFIAHERNKKIFNKVSKRLSFYQLVKRYLESNPTKVFVQNEHERITNRMLKINSMFSHAEHEKQDAKVVKE